MPRKTYNELLSERKAWYKNLRPVYCPCLSELIYFTSKGFRHLKYDGSNSARSRREYMYRLGLLPLVIPVIKNAKAVYKYVEPTYNKQLEKYNEFWALREKVGKKNTVTTVILRRMGKGQIHFYSVMKRRDKKRKPRIAA